jgi:predicted kinase
MKKLIIMRGLPGSGKSTWVKHEASMRMEEGVRSVAICSTDDQFLNDKGEYVFDPAKLGINHTANQKLARTMMQAGVELVIIDNTNTTHKEMKPYKDHAAFYGYEVEAVTIGEPELFPGMDGTPHKFNDYIDKCARLNTHKVPRDVIEKMARRFEQ